MNFGEYVDHQKQMQIIEELWKKYSFLNISSIGKSILGKEIPLISLGKGKKSVLYIGTHHALEWITGAILLKFIGEYCDFLEKGKAVWGVSLPTLFECRTLFIIPMLNPDGVDYVLHGLQNENIIYDRVLKMNDGSKDFSLWQANARGVDLNHNYDAGFYEYKLIEKELGLFGGAPTKYSGEYPESEPEVRSVCHFCRATAPKGVLTLHTQGQEIYFSSGDMLAKSSLANAKIISRLTSYSLSSPKGTACYGGFTDWFIREFNEPSFTLECGKGKNPLPFSDFPAIYSNLRQMLFTFPILI